MATNTQEGVTLTAVRDKHFTEMQKQNIPNVGRITKPNQSGDGFGNGQSGDGPLAIVRFQIRNRHRTLAYRKIEDSVQSGDATENYRKVSDFKQSGEGLKTEDFMTHADTVIHRKCLNCLGQHCELLPCPDKWRD